MYNFNEHIKKILINEYSGSEKKRTVILDDGKKYLLKMPDPVREKNKELSYINNSISEYIGCKIFKMLGIPVQEVILGEFQDSKGKRKIACACQDIRKPGETMHPVQIVNLGSDDDLVYAETSIENVEKFAQNIQIIPYDKIINFYYDMFVVDALLGNTDRHNGNWAILTDEEGNGRLSPVYDCGSSLSPLLSDNELTERNAGNEINNVYSAVLDENKKRINYKEYLLSEKNDHLNKALKRMVPKINLKEIDELIDTVDYINQERKAFYKKIIKGRYEQVLLPALEQQLNINNNNSNRLYTSDEIRDAAQNFIKPVKAEPEFKRVVLKYKDTYFGIKRVAANKIIIDDQNKVIGIAKTGNNTKDIIAFLDILNVNIKEQNHQKINQKDKSSSYEDLER